MSTDVPAPRRPDGCSSEYVAAVDQALDVANTPAAAARFATFRLGEWHVSPRILDEHEVWSAANPGLRTPDPVGTTRARRRMLLRTAIRTALRTLVAFAAIAAFGVLGAAVLVDWFAPTAGPSACSQVALPLVVMVAALAVIGLVGAIAMRVAGPRRGDTS